MSSQTFVFGAHLVFFATLTACAPVPASAPPSIAAAPRSVTRVLPVVHIVTRSPAKPTVPPGPAGAPLPGAPKTADETIRKQLHPAATRCFNEALRSDPKLFGRVVVTIDVVTDGSVAAAFTSYFVGLSDAVTACITDAARHLVFPTIAAGGTSRLNAPMTFVHEGEGFVQTDVSLAERISKIVSSCFFAAPGEPVAASADLRLTIRPGARGVGMHVDGADALPESFRGCIVAAAERPDWPPLEADEVIARIVYATELP